MALSALSVAVLAGCSGASPAAAPPAAPPPAVPAPAPDAPAPAAPAPAVPAFVPAPHEDPVPARTSGRLDERALPAPAKLGGRWTTYVDPGDHEKGFTGNGSWVRERSPADVVAGVRPVGCRGEVDSVALPAPVHAIEGTYEGARRGQAVALALDFAGEQQAGEFLRGVGALVSRCGRLPRAVGRDAPLVVGIEPEQAGGELVVDRRREAGRGASPLLWSEAVARTGRRVTLLMVGTEPGTEPPGAAAMVAAVRAVR